MDLRFFREPRVPNFEGEFAVEEEGDSVSEEGNAWPFFFVGVAGALAGGGDEETPLEVDVGAAPLVDGFASSVAAGAAGSVTSTGDVDAGSGEMAAGSEMGSETAT